MSYTLLAGVALCLLISGMMVSLHIGRKYAIWQEKRERVKKHEDMPMAEGAVMGLMALLVSFTFANANTKFDARRLVAVEDVNATSTAYILLDLLAEPLRGELRQDFKDYVDARVVVYQALPNLDKASQAAQEAKKIQKKIWQKAAQSCQKEPLTSACVLLLPALSKMFDSSYKSLSYTKIHPPVLVFTMLVLVALLSALLTGYRMKNIKITHSLHIISYVFIIAFTIYTIIDIDYPRLGFIRMDTFDQEFIKLRASM